MPAGVITRSGQAPPEVRRPPDMGPPAPAKPSRPPTGTDRAPDGRASGAAAPEPGIVDGPRARGYSSRSISDGLRGRSGPTAQGR